MSLQRTGNAKADIHRQVFDFKMLDGDTQIRFTIGFSIVRDLDGREVMPQQINQQFDRHRDKIEVVAQHVFLSRIPTTNDRVALKREDFFT